MLSAQAIHLGPLMLPWTLLIAIGSILLSFAIIRHLRAYFSIDNSAWQQFKDSFWTAIWIGMLFARLAFVAAHPSFYLEQPIEIIKIQDKGFNLWAGVIAAAVWLLWKNRKASIAFSAILILSVIAFNATGNSILKKYQQRYQQFPAVELMDLQQRPVKLSQFIGQPTVMNLWASWCPPCHREMPVLAQAQLDHPEVQWLMINQAENAATVDQYLSKNQLQFKHLLLDPNGETAIATGMFGLPSTLFFNARGELIETHMGEISPTVLQQKLARIISDTDQKL